MIKVGPRPRFVSSLPLCLLTVVISVPFLNVSARALQCADQVHVVPRPAKVHSAAVVDGNAGPESISGSGERSVLHSTTKPFRVNVDLVLVPVVVTDTRNRPVMGLAKDNFQLLDGGQEQQIRFFSLEDEPLSVALVLDLSNSMTSRIAIEQSALGKFFENANPDDEYFAIGVSTHPILLADSTQHVSEIQAKLAFAKPAGYTALLDSIYLALNKLKTARYERKVILIISDGGENDSRFNYHEIKELAEESDVLVYAIRPVEATPVFRTIEEKLGNHLLGGITEATGGRTISLTYNDNVPAAAATISTELRNQYVLGFHPTTGAREGKHRIRVRMLKSNDSNPVHLHYRKQYSAAVR
jgi:Ca-activated chloride channel family protein